MKYESAISHLECTLTGERFDASQPHRTNPANGKPLFARYDLDQAKATLTKGSLSTRPKNMWRYREVMPVIDDANIITLGEGGTPLLKADRLAAATGMNTVLIKDEGVNPTGSFKARGLGAAVSKAKELGQMRLTMPSAGNAAGAMSAYAAVGGMEAHVFMPKDAPIANKVECEAYGAKLTLVDGFITDAGQMSQRAAEELGLFDVSTLREPYRAGGQKDDGLRNRRTARVRGAGCHCLPDGRWHRHRGNLEGAGRDGAVGMDRFGTPADGLCSGGGLRAFGRRL